MENLQNALSCLGLTISTLSDKGRCLIAARDIFPGEVIITQEPYVSVPNNSSVDSRCDRCLSSSNLKRCSACHVVWYCGSTCQKLDWKVHQLECQMLSRLEKGRCKFLTPSMRLMVKLYIRRKLQFEKIIQITSTDNYKLVEALVSHMSEIDEKQLVLYAQMANLVYSILQWPDINIREIAENFSKLACNAHTICDGELRSLGTGLYPIISIINHSCLPNAVLIFEGRVGIVRSVQHIHKGTEVLISYIETAGSTKTRQKALKEQYLFTCTCARCMKMGHPDEVQESAILEGYRCKDDQCLGFLLCDSENGGFLCQWCRLVRNKDEIKRTESETKTMLDKVARYTSSYQHQEAFSIYQQIEKLQLQLCHPFSISLLRTREALLKILMELNDWHKALAYCLLTIPVYQRLYPGFHPLLGLQYFTCGKLEWLLGDTENAVKSLSKAWDILRITHGTSAPLTKDLQNRLEEARAEASYKRSTPIEDSFS